MVVQSLTTSRTRWNGVNAESLQPTLSWQPFPTGPVGDEDAGSASDVTYDLGIWEGQPVNPWVEEHEPIYFRTGLRETSHTVEHELKPSTGYAWSVRARFDLHGHPRLTRWARTTFCKQAATQYRTTELTDHPQLAGMYSLRTP